MATLADSAVEAKFDTLISLVAQLVSAPTPRGIPPAPTPGAGKAGASPPAAGASTGSAASAMPSLINLLPKGTVFALPFTLQTFNELLGATAMTEAEATAVELNVTIPPYSTSAAAQYQVPPGRYALGMSDWYFYFSHHSPGITLTGYLNYGLPDEAPITEPNVLARQDIAISRFITGNTPLKSNLTIVLSNNTPVAVDFTFGAVFLLVDIQRWKDTYAPIFEQAVRAWVDQFAADARQIGAATA